METTQATQKRVRYQFEIFCMKVIDGERCDYLRKLMKKMGWEGTPLYFVVWRRSHMALRCRLPRTSACGTTV